MKYTVIITCNKSKTVYEYVNGFYAESARSSTFPIWALCWYGKSCIGTALLLCVVDEMFSRALVIHHCIWRQILTENNGPTQVNDIHVHVYVFVMAWNLCTSIWVTYSVLYTCLNLPTRYVMQPWGSYLQQWILELFWHATLQYKTVMKMDNSFYTTCLSLPG